MTPEQIETAFAAIKKVTDVGKAKEDRDAAEALFALAADFLNSVGRIADALELIAKNSDELKTTLRHR